MECQMELLALFSVRHLRVGNLRMFAFHRLAHCRPGHGSVDVARSVGFELRAELGRTGGSEAALRTALHRKASLLIHFNAQTLASLPSSDFVETTGKEAGNN